MKTILTVRPLALQTFGRQISQTSAKLKVHSKR